MTETQTDRVLQQTESFNKIPGRDFLSFIKEKKNPP